MVPETERSRLTAASGASSADFDAGAFLDQPDDLHMVG
jgi:hypothetical protein